MGIIGSKDLGIGTIAPQAYVRLYGVSWRPSVPEVEIEVYCYFNKDARNTEIIKTFLQNYIAQTPSLTPDQLTWIQNNWLCRSAYPLQITKWATNDLSSFPNNPATDDLMTFFYGWIKTNQVMGPVTGDIADDVDTHDVIITNFKTANPTIFPNGYR